MSSPAPITTTPRDLATLPTVQLLPSIFQKAPFGFLEQAARQHGSFVRLMVGPKPVYLVSDADLFQHVLRDEVKNYRKSPFLYNAAKMMVGEGLLTSEGDFWLRQRRMIQPQFHRQRIAFFANIMTDAMNEVMQEWERSDAPDQPVELGARMAHLTVEMVSRALFGTHTLPLDEIGKLGQEMVAAANYVALRGYMPFVPQSIPLPGHGRFQQAMKRLTQAVNTIIAAGENGDSEGDNLINMLMEVVDEETQEGMTHAQLFDEVMTVFSAGFETTATALTWLWVLLAQSPAVEEKLRAEVSAALGDRTPTFDDLPKLGYCRQVFQEAMRVYPPIPMLPRTAQEDDVANGYNIPKGTILLMFYYGLHHNPAYWPQPEVFDPARFSSAAQAEGRHRFAYLPFSAGPRQCIGMDFAIMEGVLALAMLVQRYRVSLVPDQDMTPNLSATLKPRKDIYVHMTAC